MVTCGYYENRASILLSWLNLHAIWMCADVAVGVHLSLMLMRRGAPCWVANSRYRYPARWQINATLDLTGSSDNKNSVNCLCCLYMKISVWGVDGNENWTFFSSGIIFSPVWVNAASVNNSGALTINVHTTNQQPHRLSVTVASCQQLVIVPGQVNCYDKGVGTVVSVNTSVLIQSHIWILECRNNQFITLV